MFEKYRDDGAGIFQKKMSPHPGFTPARGANFLFVKRPTLPIRPTLFHYAVRITQLVSFAFVYTCNLLCRSGLEDMLRLFVIVFNDINKDRIGNQYVQFIY